MIWTSLSTLPQPSLRLPRSRARPLPPHVPPARFTAISPIGHATATRVKRPTLFGGQAAASSGFSSACARTSVVQSRVKPARGWSIHTSHEADQRLDYHRDHQNTRKGCCRARNRVRSPSCASSRILEIGTSSPGVSALPFSPAQRWLAPRNPPGICRGASHCSFSVIWRWETSMMLPAVTLGLPSLAWPWP